jgi:hypothetical protein
MKGNMNQDALLKLIAESGYNIGYAAKKHLATFDIVEKVPGWIGLISIGVGIYALIFPALEQKPLSAAFILIGIASLFISFYAADKDKYAVAGGKLTQKFHDLRVLYQLVKSQPGGTDMGPFIATHDQIQAEALQLGVPKQIFLSDWYAHYKFFWQAQTGWMDEQLHFKFVRDKLPLSVTILALIAIGWAFLSQVSPLVGYLRNFCGQ